MHTLNLDKMLAVAARKQVVEQAIKLRSGGKSWRDCGALLGVQWNNLHRWVTAYLEHGAEGLADERSTESGRASTWEALAEDPDVRNALLQLYLSTVGASCDQAAKHRHTGSITLTLERFADHELCPPTLAQALRRGSQPKPLVNVIRTITVEMEQRYRGAKHTSLNGTLIMRRNGMERMADGTEQPIMVGDWWVFDDMSTNFPFWFMGEDATPQVARQGLYAYDKVGRWIGFEEVGTGRDSYTAAIILRFVRRLVQALGLPRRGIVFEKSVWKSRAICGVRLTQSGTPVEDEFERPEITDDERHKIDDGIKALGIELIYTWTPRGKEIEGAFNYFQRVFGTFAIGKVNIGRHAGEFEIGAKALRMAHAGSHHPEDLGFLHIDKHADITQQTMEWIIARGHWDREGEQRVIPAYPIGRPITQDHLAVFLPHTTELTIRGGKVSPEVAGKPFDFVHPENFAALGDGYRVYIKFDPTEPTLGAAIYNRETASINHFGYKDGALICWAEWLPPVASFDWREAGERDDKAGSMRRRYAHYTRTAFRAIGMPQAKASTARDGKGNVIEISASASLQAEPERAETTRSEVTDVPTALPAPRGGFRLRALEEESADK